MFRYINPACQQLLGTSSPEELLGTSIGHRVADACRDEFMAWLTRSHSSRNTTLTFTPVFLRMDGSEIACTVSAALIEHKKKASMIMYLRETIHNIKS